MNYNYCLAEESFLSKEWLSVLSRHGFRLPGASQDVGKHARCPSVGHSTAPEPFRADVNMKLNSLQTFG